MQNAFLSFKLSQLMSSFFRNWMQKPLGHVQTFRWFQAVALVVKSPILKDCSTEKIKWLKKTILKM